MKICEEHKWVSMDRPCPHCATRLWDEKLSQYEALRIHSDGRIEYVKREQPR